MKKKTKLQELEERIQKLEREMGNKTIIIPNYPPVNLPANNPNLHYHGSMPCYNNPCVWC